MTSQSLRQFVDHALEVRRIRFGDLQRLRRDVLPGRIASREDAEMLLGLDCSVRAADRDWGDYLVAAVRDFVIWGMEPIGAVNGEKAAWLFAAVSDGGPTRNGRAIFREVTREARLMDEDAALRSPAAQSTTRGRTRAPYPRRRRGVHLSLTTLLRNSPAEERSTSRAPKTASALSRVLGRGAHHLRDGAVRLGSVKCTPTARPRCQARSAGTSWFEETRRT